MATRTNRALVVIALVCVTGCSCAGEPEPSVEHRAGTNASGSGGDEGLFPPVGDSHAAPSRERFELVELERGSEMARGRSWAGAHRLRGDDEGRDHVGNWLCRLVALYGPPPGVREDGFRYVFVDHETERVLVAYADRTGPAMGAVMTAPEGWRLGDEDRTGAAIDAFVALVDSTRPVDCTLEIGAQTIGMADGRPLE